MMNCQTCHKPTASGVLECESCRLARIETENGQLSLARKSWEAHFRSARLELDDAKISMSDIEVTLADGIRRLREQRDIWRNTLKTLIARMALVFDSPEYLAVWTTWQNHYGKYAGPCFTDEYEAARELLKEAGFDEEE
jgi:hypothetical protein